MDSDTTLSNKNALDLLKGISGRDRRVGDIFGMVWFGGRVRMV
jgi:hypothetical protein